MAIIRTIEVKLCGWRKRKKDSSNNTRLDDQAPRLHHPDAQQGSHGRRTSTSYPRKAKNNSNRISQRNENSPKEPTNSSSDDHQRVIGKRYEDVDIYKPPRQPYRPYSPKGQKVAANASKEGKANWSKEHDPSRHEYERKRYPPSLLRNQVTDSPPLLPTTGKGAGHTYHHGQDGNVILVKGHDGYGDDLNSPRTSQIKRMAAAYESGYRDAVDQINVGSSKKF